MILLWQFYWPVALLGLVLGLAGGTYLFRPIRIGAGERLSGQEEAVSATRKQRRLSVALAFALALAGAFVWHGPLGAGERFAAEVERPARLQLNQLEMLQVRVALARKPLRRILVLGGPADEFQHKEIQRIMAQQPGVSSALWVDPPADLDRVR